MDVDNDNFYDEIASFMPTPGDYNLDDLDEIIRSTDSHLDASLDLNIFSKSLEQNDFDMDNSTSFSGGSDQSFGIKLEQRQHDEQLTTSQQDEINFNFSAFPSPATSHQSSSGDYTSPYETPARTSSTSSVDGDNFNPDDFINFFNDDDVKVEHLTHDTIRQLNRQNERNTPSPTGSCISSSGSSSGSSTSGIQSDISSIASMPQNVPYALAANEQEQDELSEFIKFRTQESDNDVEKPEVIEKPVEKQHKHEGVFRMPVSPNNLFDEANNLASFSLPILPVATFQPVQSVNVMQGSIIPVQTLPLSSITPVVKIENKTVTTKPMVVVQEPRKLKANTAALNAGTIPTKIAAPPPNTKPKTIFLSSNDFKALMQKMNNTNGTVGEASSKKTAFSNGQMPKIIMKTASGKYIAANKMPSSSIQTKSGATETTSAMALTNPSQQSTKLLKTSSSTMAKHHQQHSSKVFNTNSRSAAVMAAAARTSLQHSKGCRTDFNMPKGFSEDKIVKKQLRMLKNRESASLSRKKKKEYVEHLEYRISNLEKENYSLKGENSCLRSQLMAFAKTCDCKHRNVSEFILNTLSMNETHQRGGATVLDDIDSSFLIDEDDSSDQSERGEDIAASSNASYVSARSSTRHVRIAPKPLNASSSINRNFKHRMNASTVKKNIAVLFAMAFMVTLNVGNFQSYLNKTTLENALEATAGGASNNNEGAAEPAVVATGRRLLWVPNEHEFHEQQNRSKREADFNNMPPPPLHFLRPVNRSLLDEQNGTTTTTKDKPPIKAIPSVKYGPTAYGNGTNYAQENNMRLARNLHKWIGGNDYLNLTGSGNGIGGRMAQYKFATPGDYEDYDLRTPTATVGVKQKRKILLGSDAADQVAGKQKKYDIDAAAAGEQNSLGLFKPRISEEYLKLFKGIKRQDDTFYVLSFNLDHILLPASSYNTSARPKMSLMLPAGDPSMNGDIVLMQIDCEVINTTEIELKSHMIPEKLRPPKYGPHNNVHVNPNDVANNETKSTGAAAASKASSRGAGGEIHLKREQDFKEKPAAPRTYFMMGPKNQSPAAKGVINGETVIKKRPTIIKLNANDSVIGSGILNVRNSTLFTRMKDTVVNSGSTSGLVAAASATTATDVRKLM